MDKDLDKHHSSRLSRRQQLNKMENTMSFWKKTGAVLGVGAVALAGGFAGGALGNSDTNALQTSVDALSQKVVDNQLILGNMTVTQDATQDVVISLQDKILEEDAWESTTEVLALDELEDRDYKDLGNWLLDEYNMTQDREDLELSVSIRDTDFSSMDVDEENGIVTFDLKVRYEDDNGDKIKKYITATVEIEDGEVEDLSFAEQ